MYAAQQLNAYRTVQTTTVSGREMEALVLTKAALKLSEIQNNWDSPDRDAKLDEALRHNQMVWSIFQGELMKADNPLPKELKQDILSLSAFIDKRIFEVMAKPAPEKLTVIININLNLAAGLRAHAEERTIEKSDPDLMDTQETKPEIPSHFVPRPYALPQQRGESGQRLFTGRA